MAFLGEIRLWGGPTAPPGWAICDGSELPQSAYGALMASMGLTYGGQFALRLPDLRGRTFVHVGPGRLSVGIGVYGGTETVSLLPGQVPTHSHAAGCHASNSNTSVVAGSILANSTGAGDIYFSSTGGGNFNQSLAGTVVGVTGSGQPHSNIGPYLALNWIICISGTAIPTAGASSGGGFTNFGGMLMYSAFLPDIEPAGWMRCDGQSLLRSTFSGLFSLIGTLFGFVDSTHFNLPNLTDQRTLNGAGTGSGLATYAVGDMTGESSHVLDLSETPSHSHDLYGVSEAGTDHSPNGEILGSAAVYHTGTDGTSLKTGTVNAAGVASPSHSNEPPFTGGTVLIAVNDVDPDPIGPGEIRAVLLTSAPTGWALCDGSSYTTSGEPALFDVIGYTYGGTGPNFNVPDLRSRVPKGAGTGVGLTPCSLGETGGTETVTLTPLQMAAHSHVYVTDVLRGFSADTSAPSGASLMTDAVPALYRRTGSQVTLGPDSIRASGGGGAHNNLAPQCAVNFIIKK